MLLISEYIEQTADKNATAEEFCEGVTAFVRDRYDSAMLPRLAVHPEERLTASCIVYSRNKRQIWMIGDCQCLVGGCLYENPKPYEDVLARKRADILKALVCEGMTVEELRGNDLGRKAIIPEMIETMRNQNKTYAVVDGYPIPMEKVRIIRLTEQPQTIVMASDGYPFLLPTLAESEKTLSRQLEKDPLNIYEFTATKAYIQGNNSFDDRSFVCFRT